jgi:hypothetical protein
MGAWIFYPTQVEFFVSMDGAQYKSVGIVKNDVPLKKPDVMIQDLVKKLNGIKAQYVKVIATNIGKCPDWHLGAGGKAWIFADEIIIK